MFEHREHQGRNNRKPSDPLRFDESQDGARLKSGYNDIRAQPRNASQGGCDRTADMEKRKDAKPRKPVGDLVAFRSEERIVHDAPVPQHDAFGYAGGDRKSTRLNSSH